MTNPTFRDIEQLSASLDGRLNPDQARRLEARLAADRELAGVLADLRFSRSILRRTPRRRIPYNFTLRPNMARIRAPLPRLVPAFSWASAVALLLFFCTVGTNLVKGFAFGAAAPVMMAAPGGMGGGGGAEDSAQAGTNGTEGPVAAEGFSLATATPDPGLLTASQPGPDTGERSVPPVEAPKQSSPASPWPAIWLGLAALLIAAAVFTRWFSQQAFKRKLQK